MASPVARVFAQQSTPRLDLAALVTNARRYFRLELNVLAERAAASDVAPSGTETELELADPARGWQARFLVRSRPRTAADLEAARVAELAGRAAGMADLAARCVFLWELFGDEPDSAATLSMQGLLASVALGPVMPRDLSSLYGVRGARERAEAALRRSKPANE